ncbi:hypothetical protein CUMW_110020 [Citrus unshiu]|nr:hypothetical protein CUMW_110020 [Citrus unshiu]
MRYFYALPRSFHLGTLWTSLSHAISGDNTCSEQLESVCNRGTESDVSIFNRRFSSVEHKRLFYTKSLRLPNRLFRSGRLPVSGSGRPVRP